MGFDNLSLYPDIFLGPAIDLARDDEIDDALEVALAQREFISVSRLSFEQSLRLQRREQYSVAAEYSSTSLDTWRIHFDGASEETLAAARPTELRIVNTAAVHYFKRATTPRRLTLSAAGAPSRRAHAAHSSARQH